MVSKQLFITILSIVYTYISSKKCDTSYVEANPSFRYDTVCANRTRIVNEKMEVTFKNEFKKCEKSNTFCPFSESLAEAAPVFCANYTTSARVAGQSCNHDLDCYFQDCVSGVCRGRGYNETCIGHEHCQVGYACRDKNYQEGLPAKYDIFQNWRVCVPQIDNGHTICSEDEHCANNMGCFTSQNENKYCVPYFSLPNDTPSTNGKFCLSGFIVNSKCAETEIIFEDKKTNANYECLENTDTCLYQIKDKPNNAAGRFPLPCICSRSLTSKPYCPLDTKSSKYAGKFDKLKKSNILNVHTTLRWNQTTQYDKDDLFPLYQESTDGVFRTIETTFDQFSTSSNLVASLMSILLVFLYAF